MTKEHQEERKDYGIIIIIVCCMHNVCYAHMHMFTYTFAYNEQEQCMSMCLRQKQNVIMHNLSKMFSKGIIRIIQRQKREIKTGTTHTQTLAFIP